MQRMLLLFLMLLLLSSGRHSYNEEQVILDRIEYIYNLKRIIDQSVWKGFADKKFDLPLIYYTANSCYVANPTKRFIASFSPRLVFENRELKIYKTRLIDSAAFHMETSVTFGDTSSAYNHRSPFMNCSSFEITQRFVQDVNSTEQWATMVLHEYFHSFQFKHPTDLDYFEKNIAMSDDTLRNIYKSKEWFREGVNKENDILLAALHTADSSQVKALVDSFFIVREQRRMHTREELNSDITPIENTFETREGTGRYVEYSIYSSFAKKAPDKKLLKSDTAYHSYQYFRTILLRAIRGCTSQLKPVITMPPALIW